MGAYGKREAETILQIGERAARIMADSVLREEEISEEKGHGNFVTKYDVAVQEFLIGGLSQAFPEACFFAEEKKDNVLTDAPTFIIDPIDGTANFVFDLHHSAISIALCVQKKTVIAVVIDPYLKESFYAILGEGAYIRKEGKDKRISVRNLPLSEAMILVGTDPYRKKETGGVTSALLAHALHEGIDIRRMGAATLDLAYIAAGRASLFAELFLSPWDYAAGMLLVTEAGGCVSTFSGAALSYTPSSVLAGAPMAYDTFFKEVLPNVPEIKEFLQKHS